MRTVGLCTGMTDARFVTTTELYPDSRNASATQCEEARRRCGGDRHLLRR